MNQVFSVSSCSETEKAKLTRDEIELNTITGLSAFVPLSAIEL